MTRDGLAEIYRDYIACLNRQDWHELGRYVDDGVQYNGRRIGFAGYRGLLQRNFEEIPGLRFDVALMVVDPPHVASRLVFDCTPTGRFLGLPVDGRRVVFPENVFYAFEDGKIATVWSVIDKAAIEAALQQPA
jgi:predicted ester cyclase